MEETYFINNYCSTAAEGINMLSGKVCAAIAAAKTDAAIFKAATTRPKAKEILRLWKASDEAFNNGLAPLSDRDYLSEWAAETQYAELALEAQEKLAHAHNFKNMVKYGPADTSDQTVSNGMYAVNSILKLAGIEFRWSCMEGTTVLKDGKSFIVLRQYNDDLLSTFDTLQAFSWCDSEEVLTIAPKPSDWFELLWSVIEVVRNRRHIDRLPSFFNDK